MDPHAAFQLLQPASIGVARDQSVESIRALCLAIEQVLATESDLHGDDSSSCINDLKEYLIFPLVLILKSGKKCSWTMQEELVRCLLLVLRHSNTEDFHFFQEIFSRLFILLTDKDNPQKGSDVSEDCKQIILKSVTALVHNSSDVVKDKIFSNVFRPQLGHAVFVCVKLAQGEKNRSLRIDAIECLLAMGQRNVFAEMSEKKQAILSKTFTNFLPGIVTGLAKIVTGDEKQGHKVTAAAIDAWSYFVVLVMRDDFLGEEVSHMEENETVAQLRTKLFGQEVSGKKSSKASENAKKQKFYIPEPEEEEITQKLPSVDINRKWIHGTSEKLLLLLQSITKLVSHSHWKVRFSLLQLSEQIICKCHRSLSGAVVMAVQVIITLRSDDIVDVGSAAQDALLAVMNVIGCEDQNSQEQKGLYELLEEHLYALATQLPTVFKQQNDTKTLSTVYQLVGCLEVLGERIAQLMTWPSHSLRLLRSLRFGLTVDTTDSDLLLERTSAEDPFSALSIKPSLGRDFKYFQDVRVFESIATSCKLIGYHSDITVVSDLCLELLQETQPRKEMFILFTLVLQGRDRRKWKDKDGGCFPHEENEKAAQNIIDMIVNLEVFDMPLYVMVQSAPEDDNHQTNSGALVPVNKQQNISVDVVKSNTVLVANALNLISATAQMIGKDFEMFLSDILCSVMEKAGEANVLVGYTGRNTLAEIAQACGYGTVAKLIENSVPHYWYSLSLKLKRLLQYPSAPLVLQVCLEYASIDVIAFTEELVQDVLVCLDTYHSDQALPLLRVLLVYVTAVIRYESNLAVVDESSGNTVDCELTGSKSREKDLDDGDTSEDMQVGDGLGGLASFLKDYHKKQLDVKRALDEESQIGHEDDHDMMQNDASKGMGSVNEHDEESEMEERKKEPPVYIKHVVEILEKCSHLLYYQERKIKLVILEVIKAGSEALAKWENERLPVFHKLWKPLTLRLKDVDFIVMMRSFEVLTVMAISSGDFLKRRILKEIFPVVFSFLKKQSHVSLKKTKKSGYYLTAAYKAQCSLLKYLPSLLRALDLGVTEMNEFVDVLMFYLDTRQPQQLLSYGMVIVKQISESHPHHIWLALAYMQPSIRIVPPVSILSAVKIKSTAAEHLPKEAVELFDQLS